MNNCCASIAHCSHIHFTTKQAHAKGTHAVNSVYHQSQANIPKADVRAFDADLTSGINHVKRGAPALQ
jgi:hypothetical protein